MFTGAELDGVQSVVMTLLGVGVAITIALVVFRLGKRAANRL